jgi:hypothetical protein
MSVARLTTDGGGPAPSARPGRRLERGRERGQQPETGVDRQVLLALERHERDRASPDRGPYRGQGLRSDRRGVAGAGDALTRDLVLEQPVGDAGRLGVRVLGLVKTEQDDRQQAEARENAQIEVDRVERALHDLGVGREDREALLALGPEELQVEIDVGLRADAGQEPLDDLRFHQRRTAANAAAAASSSAISTYSSAAWACSTAPGP